MMIRLSLALLILLSFIAKGQTREVGLFTGYSNLISDVGNNNPISPIENGNFVFTPTLGIFYKEVLNPRMLIRFSGYFSTLKAIDANSPRLDRIARNLTTSSNLFEASAIIEYNFFDIYNGVYNSTPYLFAGFGGIMHQDTEVVAEYENDGVAPVSRKDFDTLVVNRKSPYRPKITIPFGVGYKFRIQEKYMIALEFGVRATRYDNLDGSNPKKYSLSIADEIVSSNPILGIQNTINQAQNKYKTGNPKNFDWYTFTGISFSYLFGDPPCYCK